MAQNALFARPWNFEVANAGAFTAPVMAGVEAGVRDRQQGIENERQNKLLGFQEKRLGMDVEKANEERMKRVEQKAGNVAALVLQNPEAYAGKWGSFVDTHLAALRKRDPNAALDPSYYDPKTGPMRVLADAGMANTWMDYQIRQQSAANEKARLGLAYSADARAKASHDAQMSQYENMPPQARAQAASTLGLTPGTPNYNAFIATGKYAPPESDTKIMPGSEHGLFAVNPKTQTAVPLTPAGDKSDSKFNEEIAKGQAKQFDEMTAGFASAQTNLGKVEVMKQLSAVIGQPGIANTLANSRLGAAARAVGLAPEQMASIEAWTAMVNQMVPGQRPPGSGTMSDKDVELFKGSLPALAATKEGREFILAQIEGVARYDASRARIAAEVVAGRMNRKQASDRLMALPNPLDGVAQNLERFGIRGLGQPQAQPQQQVGGGLQPGGDYIFYPETKKLVLRGGQPAQATQPAPDRGYTGSTIPPAPPAPPVQQQAQPRPAPARVQTMTQQEYEAQTLSSVAGWMASGQMTRVQAESLLRQRGIDPARLGGP